MAGPDSEFWFCFSKAFAMPMPMSMGDCGGVSAGSRAGDWQSVLNYLFEARRGRVAFESRARAVASQAAELCSLIIDWNVWDLPLRCPWEPHGWPHNIS